MDRDLAKSTPIMPNTFHAFTALPRELRDSIWKHTLPGPRIITVGCKSLPPRIYANLDPHVDTNGSLNRSSTFGGCFEFGNLSPPTLLHTCRESRMVALAKFETCFSYTPTPTVKFYEKPRCIVQHGTFPKQADKAVSSQQFSSHGIWFQPFLDTIYFPDDGRHDWSSLVAFSNDDVMGTRKIRLFALDDGVHNNERLEIIFKHFPDICEIFVVIDGFDEDYLKVRERRLKGDLATFHHLYPRSTLKSAVVWDAGDFMSPDFQTRDPP